jgi:hypothetical protein
LAGPLYFVAGECFEAKRNWLLELIGESALNCLEAHNWELSEKLHFEEDCTFVKSFGALLEGKNYK